MDVDKYQELAMRTLNPEIDKKELILNASMGLCGESGEVIDLVKQVLTEGFDFMLGEGTFEKLYKQTPSVIKLTNVFKQLSDSLKEELESAGIEESQKELGQKYLAEKAK